MFPAESSVKPLGLLSFLAGLVIADRGIAAAVQLLLQSVGFVVWSRMPLVFDQAIQHRFAPRSDRPRRFVCTGPGQVARVLVCCAAMASVPPLAALQASRQATEQPSADPPLPDIHRLIQDVQEHQKELDKIRESYTFTSSQTGQDIDANGQVKKTVTEESEVFFVNGHIIARTVKKNGQPLSDHDQQKEADRVTKLVEKAEKTPPDKPSISVSRVLEIMDVRNERRVSFRGRRTIVFDLAGRKDAKTHGLAEDASKKLQGTIWIDEADGQVAHLEAVFTDNFHVAGGLFADVQKGSNFHFDQELVNGELWLPTGVEGTMQARVLLLKNIRRHSIERYYNFKRFKVETQQK